MKSINTQIREKIREILFLLDYLIWLLLDPSKFKKIRKKKIKKVLLIHLGAIGELLIMTTLLPALKKELNCEISFMVNKGKEIVFENNPYVSEILMYEKFKKNIEELKKRKFDLAIIIFPSSFKNNLMCLFAKISYRIGCFNGIKELPSLFYNRKTFPLHKKHVVEETIDIIKQIGINNKNPKVEFYISKKDEKNAEQKLKNLGMKKENYIIIHPGFGFSTKYKYPTKFWPPERYAKVIDYLIEKYKIKILLTGINEEKILIKGIIKKVKNKKQVFETMGLFNFGELAKIVSKAKLLIGPSTSITHLAEAFNIPVVELAGKGTLYKLKNKKKLYIWHPWMEKNRYRVLYHDEVCTGCNLMNCKKKNAECMMAISVGEIINAINELLR